MLEKQYFAVIIKDNNLVEIEKIDEERYNFFAYIFDCVYHTKNRETYPLYKNTDAGTDLLLVDGEHLYELLDDMKEQGFYDPEGVVI